MARIISFAWTTPALLARRKTVTRRDWHADYARRFHAGDIVLAYDKNPRARGKQIATLRLTHDPYWERGCDMPDDDWEREGFAYLQEQATDVNGTDPATLWRQMKTTDDGLWVIRFEIMSIP
jgi:hypothetical protein